ncbi:MAG: hypothetical protein JNM10_18605 [Planctomycetia bacterium]|nr:hypothetical protein [Planctomycetia bacterium]
MTHARPFAVLAPLLAAALLLTACGAEGPAPAPSSPSFLLAADPGAGVGVAEARARGAADDVVVVGRVREITKGLAAFTLVDLSQQYCGQTEMEGCPTPWDYCCTPKEELARNMIGVSVRAGDDVALGDVARDLRNLDVVAVRGRLVKAKDEVFLHATGWFRRERPTLPEGLEFPR